MAWYHSILNVTPIHLSLGTCIIFLHWESTSCNPVESNGINLGIKWRDRFTGGLMISPRCHSARPHGDRHWGVALHPCSHSDESDPLYDKIRHCTAYAKASGGYILYIVISPHHWKIKENKSYWYTINMFDFWWHFCHPAILHIWLFSCLQHKCMIKPAQMAFQRSEKESICVVWVNDHNSHAAVGWTHYCVRKLNSIIDNPKYITWSSGKYKKYKGEKNFGTIL